MHDAQHEASPATADTLVTYIIEYPGTNLIKIGAGVFVDGFAQPECVNGFDTMRLYLSSIC